MTCQENDNKKINKDPVNREGQGSAREAARQGEQIPLFCRFPRFLELFKPVKSVRWEGLVVGFGDCYE